MLKTKQVGSYTVSQMGAVESARLRLFSKRNKEWVEAEKKAGREVDPAMSDAFDEWSFVAACTMPYIPREDYISIPIDELKSIIETAEELNSALVPDDGPQSKKKESERTAEIYERLNEVIANNASSLPVTIHLNNPVIAYDVWTLWRATEGRFLPSQLLQEPTGLLEDMFQLDSIFEMLKERTSNDRANN